VENVLDAQRNNLIKILRMKL